MISHGPITILDPSLHSDIIAFRGSYANGIAVDFKKFSQNLSWDEVKLEKSSHFYISAINIQSPSDAPGLFKICSRLWTKKMIFPCFIFSYITNRDLHARLCKRGFNCSSTWLGFTVESPFHFQTLFLKARQNRD